MEKQLPETAGDRIGENRPTLYRALFFTFVLGLAAHGFQYLNLNPSHDYLMRMGMTLEVEGPLSLGRFLEPVYNKLLGPLTPLPWSTGLISLLWLSLTVYVVCRLFGLSRRGEVALTAAILVTNRSMISLNASYLPLAGVFTLSALTAALAVCFWQRSATEKKWQYLIPGALLTTVSLGLYQGYLFTSVTLILLCSFQTLLRGEKARYVIADGLKSIGMLLLGGVFYTLGTRIACRLTGYELVEGEYNSLTNLWANSESLTARLMACYREAWGNLFSDAVSIWSAGTVFCLMGLLTVVSAVLLVLLLRKRKLKPRELLALAAILLVMPMGINGIRLLNNECHDLMHYAFWLVLLLPVLLMHELGERKAAAGWSGNIAVLLLAVLAFSNIQMANLTYVQKELEFEATRDLMVSVMDRVEAQEGYEEGTTPVAFVGSPGAAMKPLRGKESVSRITGSHSSSAISYYTTYFSYFSNVLQRCTNVVQLTEERLQSPEVAAMPQYPAEGSVALLDGTVVVKFEP